MPSSTAAQSIFAGLRLALLLLSPATHPHPPTHLWKYILATIIAVEGDLSCQLIFYLSTGLGLVTSFIANTYSNQKSLLSSVQALLSLAQLVILFICMIVSLKSTHHFEMLTCNIRVLKHWRLYTLFYKKDRLKMS